MKIDKKRIYKQEDFVSLFTKYMKKKIEKDLKLIYKTEARLLNPEEPWIFQLENWSLFLQKSKAYQEKEKSF